MITDDTEYSDPGEVYIELWDTLLGLPSGLFYSFLF